MSLTNQKVEEIRQQFNKLNALIITKKARQDALIKEKEGIEKSIEALNLEGLEKGLSLMQRMSEEQKALAMKRLEDLGTYALQYALGQNYEMKISIPKDKNGKPKKKQETEIKIVKNGIEMDPEDSNGGGVIDIVSMALRIVTMQTYEPFIDGPIILDEPFKMVSKQFIPQLSEFMKNIAQDFGRQIILITHNDYLTSMTDHKIHVTMGPNDASIVEEIK